jgi:protein-tyrosine-phosphatase
MRLLTPENKTEPDNTLLFVCRENVGRSQVAMELWNQGDYFPQSLSAGIDVNSELGENVGDYEQAKTLISVVRKRYGIDISGNQRRSINDIPKQRLREFGAVVVLAEPDIVPEHITQLPNYLGHEIPDMKHTDYAQTESIVKSIADWLPELEKILANR